MREHRSGALWGAGVAMVGVLLALASAAQAQEPEEDPSALVRVESELIFGHYRSGGWSSVAIDVENKGNDRRVEVSLEGVGVTRSVEVDLGGRSARRVQLAAPTPRLGGLEVVVRAEGGDVLSRRPVQMERLGDRAPLLAFVGERPPGLRERQDFGGGLSLESLESEPQVARVTPTLLPEAWQGYSSVDALVWSHPAWDQLNPEQSAALRGWVLRGGHLIVAVDDDWRQAGRGALGELLPAELTGVETLERGEAMLQLLGPGPGFGSGLEAAAGDPSEAEAAAWAEAHPEAIARLYEAQHKRLRGLQYRIRTIRVNIPATPEPGHEWEPVKAEQVRERLYANINDFAEVARELSDDPVLGPRGGDMGWVRSSALESEVLERLSYLSSGASHNFEQFNRADHLLFLHVEDIRTAAPSLEEVRVQLALRLMREERAAGSLEQASLPAQLPLLQGRLKPGAQAAEEVWSAEAPLVWTWEVGVGRVTLWRSGWERLGRTPTLEAWSVWGRRGARGSEDALWQTLRLDEPQLEVNAALLILILVLYLFVIGPVDYLVLRKLRRLEWTVFTYTASILIFSGLAWVTMLWGQDNSTRLVRLQVVTWLAPGAGLPEGSPSAGPSGLLLQETASYFTSTRRRVILPPLPGDTIYSPPVEEWMAGALLDTQTLRGQPPTLEVSAAAFAMLPLRWEGERPAPVEVPVRVRVDPPTEAAPSGQAHVESALDLELDACVLSYEGAESSSWFALPARGSLGNIALRERVSYDAPRELGGFPDSQVETMMRSALHPPEGRPHDAGRGRLVCVASRRLLLPEAPALEAEERFERLILKIYF